MWNAPNSGCSGYAGSLPFDNQWIYFYTRVVLSQGSLVSFTFAADDYADLFVNSVAYGYEDAWTNVETVVQVPFHVGDNVIMFRSMNAGGPGGLIVSIRDESTGTVIASTAAANLNKWAWSSSPVPGC